MSEAVRVPMPDGTFALVDAEDAERVMVFNWRVRRHPRYGVCVQRNTSRREGKSTVKLHRFLLGAQSGQVVDHINGDPMDNRRSNLRLATIQQNNRNVRSSRNQKKGRPKGTTRCKRSGRWFAQIKVTERAMRLGPFDTELEAALAYDAAARKYFGEFAAPNFPEATS